MHHPDQNQARQKTDDDGQDDIAIKSVTRLCFRAREHVINASMFILFGGHVGDVLNRENNLSTPHREGSYSDDLIAQMTAIKPLRILSSVIKKWRRTAAVSSSTSRSASQ